MKKILVLAILLTAGLFVFFSNYSSIIAGSNSSAFANESDNDKVNICHWDNGEGGKYNLIEVNINSVSKCQDVNGHSGINHQNGKDIIPSFTDEFCTYPGQNLDKVSWISNDCKEPAPAPEVSITKSILCGTGVRTFSGTADYHGDTSTRLKVTFDPPGSNNTTTEVDNQSELTSWSFDKSVTVGSVYTIEAKVWDNSNGNGSPKDTDSWTFTQAACSAEDQCPNIAGVQETVPTDYYRSDGECFAKTHVCTDETATNYDENFNSEREISDVEVCEYSQPTDVCPNIDGVQESIPAGYHFETINDVRQCIQDPTSTPTPAPSNPGGGSGDGKSDNLGCGSHDCSGNTASSQSTGGQVLGASTGPTQAVLGLSTTSGDSASVFSLIQLAAAFGFTSLGFGLFKKNA